MKKNDLIIIVDDDSDDREIMRDAFQSSIEDAKYMFFENGNTLMEYLLEHTDHLPTLIMLDLNMPGKDGREALNEIKNHHKFHMIPVIVFTTSSSQRDQKACYNLGANCFVTKPDTFNKLIDLTACISKLWLNRL